MASLGKLAAERIGLLSKMAVVEVHQQGAKLHDAWEAPLAVGQGV